jgi:hypothetical protein
MGLGERSRTDRLLWSFVLVTAALVALITWVVLPPEKTGGLVRQPSTYFNAAYGAKAAYLALDCLGYSVTRVRRPAERDALEGIGVLFVLKPLIGLRQYELAELEDWVKQGHVLVVVPGNCAVEAFGRGRHSAPPESDETDEHRREFGSFFEEWFRIDDAATRPEATSRDSVESERETSRSGIDTEAAICAGIHELTAGSGRRFAKSPLRGPLAKMPMQAFWTDEQGAIGLRVNLGDGTIIALADSYPLSNLGIGEADNGLLLGNMARELSRISPGMIAFDEYHLGMQQRDWSPVAMVKLMLSGPWQWAVAQAIVVGALALYAGAVRFGSPREATNKPRRQRREFAEAAGRLFDEAGATSLAAETLYRHYRDRLCRALQLEPDADNARLSRMVHDRSGQDIATFLERAQRAASKPIRRQDLLTITQTLHRAVEGLDHGF